MEKQNAHCRPAQNCRPGQYLSGGCTNCVESNPITFDGSITCKCGFEGWITTYTGKCKDLKANGKYLRCYDKCPNGDCRVGPYLDSCISCQENYENTPGLLRCFCLRYDGYDVVAKYNGPCQSLIYKDNELQCPPCPANNCRPVQVIIFKTVVIVLMKMVH